MVGTSAEAIAEFQKRAADPNIGVSGAITGMETEGKLNMDKTADAMRKLPTWGGASLLRKTHSMGQTANLLKDAGFYQEATAENSAETQPRTLLDASANWSAKKSVQQWVKTLATRLVQPWANGTANNSEQQTFTTMATMSG